MDTSNKGKQSLATFNLLCMIIYGLNNSALIQLCEFETIYDTREFVLNGATYNFKNSEKHVLMGDWNSRLELPRVSIIKNCASESNTFK